MQDQRRKYIVAKSRLAYSSVHQLQRYVALNTSCLTLPLFMPGIGADNPHHPAALYHLAFITSGLN
jgi:hypothetical protein